MRRLNLSNSLVTGNAATEATKNVARPRNEGKSSKNSLEVQSRSAEPRKDPARKNEEFQPCHPPKAYRRLRRTVDNYNALVTQMES